MQFLCILCLVGVAIAFKVDFKFDADETCSDCTRESSIVSSSIRQMNDSITESFSFLQESLEMMNKSLTNALKNVKDLIEKGDSRSLSRIFLDGTNWTRFWWYNGLGWPVGETDVLGAHYGTCKNSDRYCFGRLPSVLKEANSELLAVDSTGTIYRWKFDPTNPTAHAAWTAFHDHVDSVTIVNSSPWNPTVIIGAGPLQVQDSFMYRVQYGVKSVLMDDDNCDCYTTLSMGHGMCRTGFSTKYGPASRFGVDLLHDPKCETPNQKNGLTLYFKG